MLLSLLLLVLGLYKGINLLCLLAYVMLACLILNLLLAGRRFRQLRGRRRIEEPAFAGEPFAVELTARNVGRANLFGISVEDRQPDRTAVGFSPSLRGGQTLAHRSQAMLPRRGRYRWGSLNAISAYPFGLAQRRVRLLGDQDVLILPRLGRLHRGRLRQFLAPVGSAHAPARRQALRHPTAQAEFHGLRAFRSGDSPRWIHWRTSARCGELMVREFEDVPTDNLVLVLDPAEGEHLEEAISLTATICWEWCRQRGDQCVLALAGAFPQVLRGITGPAHALHMLGALAALEGEKDPETNAILDPLTAESIPPASILAVSSRDPAPLQSALSLRLHRPVVGLGVADIDAYDFYEKPVPFADKPSENRHGT